MQVGKQKKCDSWEQRKLSDLTSLITKGTTPLDKSNAGPVNFIKVESINKDTGEIDISSWISEYEHNNYLKRSQLKENDILFSIAGTLGRVSVVKKQVLPANTNQALAIIRTKDEIIDYLKVILSGNSIEKYIRENPTIGAQPNLSLLQINDLMVDYPCKDEQIIIGKFFSKLNYLIALHRCKPSVFFRVKKCVKVLKLMCFDFISWEQCKLGDCGDFKSNGVDKLSKPNEKPVHLLNYMDVYNRRIISNKTISDLMRVTAQEKQLHDNNIEKGDIFFTPTSETADDIGHVMVIEETLENVVYSYHLMRFRPYKDIFYITFPNYGFAVEGVRKQMSLLAQGVQRFVLSKGQFESIQICLPSIQEQRNIANLLTGLDNLITLHQRNNKF